jgi:beta-galactosidase
MKRSISLIVLSLCLAFGMQAQTTETFTVGKHSFLLNGRPFVIKAAELHYERIPRAYWEHRIEMCKALGMNTVCMYVFWNILEQEENKFDFTGQNDMVAFCKLVQKHGMYIILRPGPYACAEWEMGGLPWWLLKKKNIALRTLDPFFMKRVGIYMREIGKRLAPLQLSHGGNIIMVQVENEYGSYGTDKPYMSAIRDTLRASGFTDSVLFQCDWSSNFTHNALNDLLWTMNFGTGADVDNEFKKLKELRPDSPLMCSEYWSGWFDHWGSRHETRPAADMVQGIKDMLDRNISFSLYMTHGGTTFGHWGGANSPGFAPTCTSYDYDAPISEAGWTTPKYFLLRNLLKTYLPAGDTLPAIPKAYPVISIPKIQFSQVAPLFANLPKPVVSKDIHSMEYYNQGWGSILYRTTLGRSVDAGTVMKINDVHDWAQVYADGKLLARLDRIKGESSLTLPVLKKGTRIDILVEAMGRVNFSKAIFDCKGITDNVTLNKGGNSIVLQNWLVYNLPDTYEFSKNKKYKVGSKLNVPAYYRATFSLQKTGDTFLDMSTWGKGQVWVNGHPMGRFWEIGPQQALYVPGCWLKKGENEIIILDLLGPSVTSVRGLKKPILDELRVKTIDKHRKNGEHLNLTTEKPVYQGSFDLKNGWQEVHFGKQVTGRYFCIDALSPQKEDSNVASIAEFDVLGADGKPVSRQQWKIRYADSEETSSGNYTADKIYDLQESTYWMTIDNASYPHQVVIDLGKSCTVSGFRYLPRAEKGCPGMIKDYRIYLKSTDYNY